ncbi:hypothetical protein BD410DRAFT_895675 [Rickenella mellea]|uniref:F-box domain-containing protein n=1 Tax=Rickenella mellea TaxID=50990 RepID=A0A4Y7QG96_9AGAM|nr:hypothetical protein BD410DRAFT_895675 [Rickenella mellea]
MVTSIRSAGILDSNVQWSPNLTQNVEEINKGYVDGHSKLVESISNISQCIQFNAAAWDTFDSISPPESASDFQCSIDLPELVHSLRSFEKSLDELNELRVQMKIRIIGLPNYCDPLLLERQTIRDVKRMPDEILAKVFQAGHDIDRYGHFKFAITVSHVSRRFRDLALHTPRLWTRFSLGDHPPQISTFLSRSGNVPALEIDALPRMSRHGVQSDDAISLSELFDPLLPHSSRWSSPMFRDNEKVRLAFPSHTNIRLPNLRRLSTTYDNDSDEATPISTNWAMPLLKSYDTMSSGTTNYFCPQFELTECKLVLLHESLNVTRLAECLAGMRRLQNLTLDCALHNVNVSRVVTTPVANVAVLSIHSLALRLSSLLSNRGALFEYLTNLYAHVQFRELSRLQITWDPVYGGGLSDLLTKGLSPYPSKIESVTLELASNRSYPEAFGNISCLLPGITEIGEFRIDTLQSSLFDFVTLVQSPNARSMTFKRCEWLSDDKLSELIDMYIASGNVQSLDIMVCRNVSEEFIRGNPLRGKMKMSWSLH